MQKQEAVTLSLVGETALFRSGPDSVDVPAQHVACSQLLTDMHSQAEDMDDISVPLSLGDVKAWVSFLDASEQDGSFATSLPDSVLLCALEVCIGSQMSRFHEVS